MGNRRQEAEANQEPALPLCEISSWNLDGDIINQSLRSKLMETVNLHLTGICESASRTLCSALDPPITGEM